ncbi:hypothetical protein PROVRETT_09256 [Providencia rettgeri DSM 1131]|nr:hypothetical protein PROVRETT_09256 [Providencia rettgeri DSM 1131]
MKLRKISNSKMMSQNRIETDKNNKREINFPLKLMYINRLKLLFK